MSHRIIHRILMDQSTDKIQARFPDWRVYVEADEIQRGVCRCAAQLNARFKDHVGKIVLVGILKGVVFFMADLSPLLEFEHSWYLLELSSYKNATTRGATEILSQITPEKFAEKHVIIIDELFDNGQTLFDAKEAIMTKGSVEAVNITTCTLLVKNKVTKFSLPDFFGIILEDIWIVGYGLDHKEEYRNLRCLYGLNFESEEAYKLARTSIMAQMLFIGYCGSNIPLEDRDSWCNLLF